MNFLIVKLNSYLACNNDNVYAEDDDDGRQCLAACLPFELAIEWNWHADECVAAIKVQLFVSLNSPFQPIAYFILNSIDISPLAKNFGFVPILRFPLSLANQKKKTTQTQIKLHQSKEKLAKKCTKRNRLKYFRKDWKNIRSSVSFFLLYSSLSLPLFLVVSLR